MYNPCARTKPSAELRDPAPSKRPPCFTLEAIRLARRELDSARHPSDRFQRRALHPGLLRRRGRQQQGLHRHQAPDDGAPGPVAAAHGASWRRRGRIPAGPGAGRRAGLAALRHLGRSIEPRDYREFALPYSQARVREASRAGVPVIYFSTGTSGMLELVAQSGADVIGVDWRVDLGEAWRRLGPGVAIQGNLDPVALLADWPELKKRATAVLDSAGGGPVTSSTWDTGYCATPPSTTSVDWSISCTSIGPTKAHERNGRERRRRALPGGRGRRRHQWAEHRLVCGAGGGGGGRCRRVLGLRVLRPVGRAHPYRHHRPRRGSVCRGRRPRLFLDDSEALGHGPGGGVGPGRATARH